MKTISRVLATLAVLLATTSYGADIPKLNIVPVEAEKALVAFESESPALFEITIQKVNGEIVYYKKSKKPLNEYRQVFDFSTSGPGTYRVCISDGEKCISRDMEVTHKKILVGGAICFYEPYFNFQDNRLNVSFLNTGTREVLLSIYQDNEFLTRLKMGNDLTIQKYIDFSKLEKGEYDVVLDDGYNHYSYLVSK